MVLLRALLFWLKELVSFKAARYIKSKLRGDVINHFDQLGPVESSKMNSADTITTAIEKVEGVNHYFMYFMPQVKMTILIPVVIIIFFTALYVVLFCVYVRH